MGAAELIAEALTRSNYDARVAFTAADALVIAEMDRPDSILLDINLPDASGTSTLDRLRLLHRCARVVLRPLPSLSASPTVTA